MLISAQYYQEPFVLGKPKGETYGDNEENSNFSPPSDILGAEDYVLYNNEDNDLSPMDENENYIPSTENDGRSIKEKENLVEHWRSQCNSQPVIEGNSNISPALKIPRAEDYILYDSEDSAISTIDEDVDYEPSTDNTSSDENDKLVEEDQRFNKKNEDQIINTTVNKEKDSSANSSLNKTKDLSVNQSPLGELMKNPTTVVKSSSSGIKKYSCKYCHKLVAKLARHIETVHQDLDEVKKLKLLPKIRREKNKSLSMSSRARLKIINAIRAKGNFEHNIKCTLYDNFIPCRRPQKNKSLKTVSSFAICPNCKDAFSKATLHKHYNKCSGQSSKYNRDIQCMSREVTGNIHEKAEPLLRKLVSRMRNDDVTTIIKYDYLVVLFGNLEAYKYRHSQHHTKMIRAKLRRLGRLLLEFKKVQTNITDFSSIFDPSNFSNFLKAVNNLGNFDERKDLYDTPATAFALGTLTKELSDIWIADCIEKKDMEKKILAEEFMHLYNLKFSKIVNKTVMESQTEMRIKKKVILPSLEDIKKLHNYLVEKRSKAFQDLKSEFNFKSWKTLLETTLISIQLLNRRRAGEIERLKLVHYTSLEKMENSNFDIYNNLSINAKTIANKYARILLRGKLNRTVPVLLDSEMIECLELIRKFRKEANVSRRNPYLFGIPGSVNNPEKWPSACDLMRKFSSKCDADMPFTLRGTLLRKHVATCCISLNLTNGEIDDLAKFMGHDKNIHLNIYRQPVATKDILEISQLLEKAQGIETNRNMQLNEIEIDLNMLQECPEMSSSDLEQDLDNCNPPSMNGMYNNHLFSPSHNKSIII